MGVSLTCPRLLDAAHRRSRVKAPSIADGTGRCARPTLAPFVLAFVLAAAACAGEAPVAPEADPPAPTPTARAPLPSPEEAFALPLRAHRDAAGRARAEVSRAGSAAERARAAREAAELYRLLSLREGDAAPLNEARALLRQASSAGDVPGACEAALDLARLEVRDAGDAETAYALAYRAERRFAARPEAAACVAEARRLELVLAERAPPAAVLRAIDAVPDAADLPPLEGTGHADVAAWAAEREAAAAAGEGLGGGDPPAGPAGRAVLSSITVLGDEGTEAGVGLRAVLSFEGVVVFERGELPAEAGAPRRVYFDLGATAVRPSVPRVLEVGSPALSRIRRGSPTEGQTRVVFELPPGADYRAFFLTDPYRVVVDLFAEASRPAVVSGARPARVIVLDPGHGGNEYGARFDGLMEKDLALDITRRVALALAARMPAARVLLTRQTDEVVSLEQRTAMANAVDADLFVSVHLNAAEEPVETGGVTTFLLDTSNDRQALRLAARENGTSTREVTGLQRILADLHRRDQVAASRRLAELVQASTLAGGRSVLPGLPDRGVRSAMFYVLVGARMPAVLVEASFMTKPEEAQALHTARYRQALAVGIADGIVRYAAGQ